MASWRARARGLLNPARPRAATSVSIQILTWADPHLPVGEVQLGKQNAGEDLAVRRVHPQRFPVVPDRLFRLLGVVQGVAQTEVRLSGLHCEFLSLLPLVGPDLGQLGVNLLDRCGVTG